MTTCALPWSGRESGRQIRNPLNLLESGRGIDIIHHREFSLLDFIPKISEEIRRRDFKPPAPPPRRQCHSVRSSGCACSSIPNDPGRRAFILDKSQRPIRGRISGSDSSTSGESLTARDSIAGRFLPTKRKEGAMPVKQLNDFLDSHHIKYITNTLCGPTPHSHCPFHAYSGKRAGQDRHGENRRRAGDFDYQL